MLPPKPTHIRVWLYLADQKNIKYQPSMNFHIGVKYFENIVVWLQIKVRFWTKEKREEKSRCKRNTLDRSGPFHQKAHSTCEQCWWEKNLQICDILHLFDTAYAFLIFKYHIVIPNFSTLMNTPLSLSFNFLDRLDVDGKRIKKKREKQLLTVI